MDTLINIFIAGMAVGFATEFIGGLIDYFTPYESRFTKQLLAAPFGALFCWLLGVTGWPLLVGAFAAGFLALAIMFFINRPVSIQQVMSRRLP